VIVRILGEGQFNLDDAHADVLNSLDAGLESSVESGDEAAFRAALSDLLTKVRTLGTPLPDDSLEPSDAVLPSSDSDLEEVREMLTTTDEGLIPG
jgi:hypothetical protein